MADEIRQPRNIGQVHPLNPSRNTGERQRRPQHTVREKDERDKRRNDDGKPHQVDEYV